VDGIVRFIEDCFPNVLRTPGVPEFHRKILARLIDGATNKKTKYDNLIFISAFREGAKTAVILNFIIYCVCYKLKRYIILKQSSETAAIRTLTNRFKGLLESENLIEVFGELRPNKSTPDLKDNNTQLDFITGATLVVLGLDQNPRGMALPDIRPDLVIWDDVESDENTKTKPSIEDHHVKLFEADIPMIDHYEGMGVYIATAQKNLSALYYTVMNHPKFAKFYFPLYKCNKLGLPEVDDNGDPIPQWPERFPLEECLRIEEFYRSNPESGGLERFWREYMLKIGSKESEEIPLDSVRTCNVELSFDQKGVLVKIISRDEMEIPNAKFQRADITIGVDPAITPNKRSSRTAISVVLTAADGSVILLKHVAGAMEMRDLLHDESRINGQWYVELDESNVRKQGIAGTVFRLLTHYRANRVAIETVTAFKLIYKEIIDLYKGFFRPRMNFNTTFEAYETFTQDKVDRIIAKIKPLCEMRRFYVLGKKTPVYDDLNNLIGYEWPQREAVDEIVNVSRWFRNDIADSVQIAISKSKQPIDDAVAIERKKTNVPITRKSLVANAILGISMRRR
jgi:hypothetical protein